MDNYRLSEPMEARQNDSGRGRSSLIECERKRSGREHTKETSNRASAHAFSPSSRTAEADVEEYERLRSSVLPKIPILPRPPTLDKRRADRETRLREPYEKLYLTEEVHP